MDNNNYNCNSNSCDCSDCTKEKEFLEWCKQTKLFSSVDAKRWGLNNYYARADRTVRDFCTDRILRRLSNTEKEFMGLVKKGNANLAWYKLIESEKQLDMIELARAVAGIEKVA